MMRSTLKSCLAGLRSAIGAAPVPTAAAAEEPAPPAPAGDRSERLLDEAFLIVLGRPPHSAEVKNLLPALRGGQIDYTHVSRQLITSSEFRLRYQRWKEATPEPSWNPELQALLDGLGPAETFVEACYTSLLGRTSDAGGRAHYVRVLGLGRTRLEVVHELVLSAEFRDRFIELCPAAGHIPVDVQLCELANPAKWDNPEWLDLLASLKSVPSDKASMHRKGFEYTQTLFGLKQLGLLQPDARVLSVGAGHECLLYWLANVVGHVVACDLYDVKWEDSFGREGDAAIFEDPETFAPFPYRRDRLTFLRMDGTRLAFRDGTFDVAYSLSSIEHFGGLEGARAAVNDMARVLRPGGMLVLATEWHLGGPPHPEVFEPEDIVSLVSSDRLELVQPVDGRVWDRYRYKPVDLRLNRFQTPHMVVSDSGTLFTSVVLFARKKASDQGASSAAAPRPERESGRGA